MELKTSYDAFVGLASELAKAFTPIDDKDHAKNVYKVLVLHLFNKAWRTFESIYLLCANGYGQEASILLRSLLEVVVSAVYISKEPSSRAILFGEYGYLEKMSFRNALIEYRDENPDDAWVAGILDSATARDLEDDRREYERVKKNYPKKDAWSGESIKDMAKKVGMHFHYILYKMFCGATHVSSMGAGRCFAIKDKTLIFSADGEDDINARWHTACVYFYSIMGPVNETFELHFDDRLKTLNDMLLERKYNNSEK